MSFDIEPDGDIHGECAEEIHRLQSEVAELRKERDGDKAAFDKACELLGQTKTTIIELMAERDTLCTRIAELEQRLAGQGPLPAAVGDEYRDAAAFAIHAMELILESKDATVSDGYAETSSMPRYGKPNEYVMLDWMSLRKAVKKLKEATQPAPTSAGVPYGLPARPRPDAPAGTIGLHWDAYSGVQMTLYGRKCFEVGMLATRPTSEATTQPAADQVLDFLRLAMKTLRDIRSGKIDERNDGGKTFFTVRTWQPGAELAAGDFAFCSCCGGKVKQVMRIAGLYQVCKTCWNAASTQPAADGGGE